MVLGWIRQFKVESFFLHRVNFPIYFLPSQKQIFFQNFIQIIIPLEVFKKHLDVILRDVV